MNAEIVMIGTELLLGQIVDTNATHIGQVLAENGIGLYQKTTVGDNRRRIVNVLEAALNRADVVLTSGGLGPTEDDLTREAVSDVFRQPLETRPELLEELEKRFAFIRRPITENNKKQAMAPLGATIIPNPNGTAPGIICGDARGEILCMPGVPHELKAMLADSVIPYLRAKYGITGVLHYRVLKVCGMGESWVDDRMGDLMATLENPTIGVLASPEWVRIRITARAGSVVEANGMIEEVEAKVRERLPGLIMGVNDDTLEGVVAKLFEDRGWTLAVGETFSGGVIAQRLAAEGAACFAGAEVLPFGAFSGPNWTESARAFAAVVRDRFQSDCALGIATDTETRTIHACFTTPESQAHWEAGYGKLDPLTQLRSGVTCLERIRRCLTGVTSPQK
ncbi:MAG: CinA family nicotinamide mononucleotide deamidase-related protein [Candidatus Hydrogenedentales bacterium]|jgi:nicotinamide-nucleotide amidase